MANFSTSSIKHLRKGVLLFDLCHHYNIELQAHGKKLYGYCPFHEDASLSLVINSVTNLWQCKRACCGRKEGGDNIYFVMKLENISFQQAVKQLQLFLKTKKIKSSNESR